MSAIESIQTRNEYARSYAATYVQLPIEESTAIEVFLRKLPGIIALGTEWPMHAMEQLEDAYLAMDGSKS